MLAIGGNSQYSICKSFDATPPRNLLSAPSQIDAKLGDEINNNNSQLNYNTVTFIPHIYLFICYFCCIYFIIQFLIEFARMVNKGSFELVAKRVFEYFKINLIKLSTETVKNAESIMKVHMHT